MAISEFELRPLKSVEDSAELKAYNLPLSHITASTRNEADLYEPLDPWSFHRPVLRDSVLLLFPELLRNRSKSNRVIRLS